MHYKIFTILIVVVAFVTTTAGTITPQVIGQQNQTSNLTALLTQARSNNDTSSEDSANITAGNDTTATVTTVANGDVPTNMT
nr:hypothetical protein [Thermoproteota archaeon]